MKPHPLARPALGSLFIGALLSSACLQGATLDNAKEQQQARGCDINVVLEKQCSGVSCHSSDAKYPDPYGGVDLFRDESRLYLVGLPAVYPDAVAYYGGVCPSPAELIIDPVNRDESLILKKIDDRQACGGSMPPAPRSLTPKQQTCIEDWVDELIATAAASGGGTSTGGSPSASGGTSSSGGASSASGGSTTSSGGATL